jgi:tRNA(Ile)-lysidine synthase
MQRALLRTWLQEQKKPLPSYEQLEQIRRQALTASDDSQLQIQCDGYVVRYFQHALWCDVKLAELPGDSLVTETNIDLGKWGKLTVPTELVDGSNQLKLTFSLPAEKLAKPGRQGRKKLKEWLKQAGVPPWLRQRRPILELNEKYLWVAGMGWFSFQTEDTISLPEPVWFNSDADLFPLL